jgi:DNA-binding transcriptional MerR regulator
MSDQLQTLGKLTRRTGVATPTLRYDEELGLLPTTESRNPYDSGRNLSPSTENTLIRIGVDLLLARAGELSGTTEEELHRSVAR